MVDPNWAFQDLHFELKEDLLERATREKTMCFVISAVSAETVLQASVEVSLLHPMGRPLEAGENTEGYLQGSSAQESTKTSEYWASCLQCQLVRARLSHRVPRERVGVELRSQV